ncbi:helix-turn-helix transcriptional regulator [Methylomagnum ishizawai]|uniref:helix-turn-helix transcriptional regulator n=1 Tax=Methylomagnum ishizawai TaxID=1760988 RepID=UPI001C7FB671|nr:hypothetical protein [Methylomagnum ishizawai]
MKPRSSKDLQKIGAPSEPHAMPHPLVYSIPEFCKAHGFSRAMLYKLWAEGKGPRVMKIGKRTLISAESAAAWRHSLEIEPDPSSLE